MPQFTEEQLIRELLKREEQDNAIARVVRAMRAELFDKQIAFIDDPSKRKAAICTRRAGKTEMWARYCSIVAIQHPASIIRIWGITKQRCKELVWDKFKDTLERHGVSFSTNETTLTIRFWNKSEIRLLGADKDKEVQKKRGDKTRMEVVLEAQMYGPYLSKLITEVAEPCLFDLQGTFCLEGTPGPICAGFWFDVTGRNDTASQWVSDGVERKIEGELQVSGRGWKCHRWSLLDNPWLPHAKASIIQMKADKGWSDDHPTYVREYLGRWVNDLGTLFYRFDPTRNTVGDDVKPWGPGWEHVLGWDLGFRDDMALVVWGWHPDRPELYEAFSWKQPGALSGEVVAVIRGLEQHGVDGTPFNFIRMVADTGGGGKMYVEDVVNRHGLAFEPAQKTHKYEHVRMMNDEFLTGRIRLRRGSVYAEEIGALQRDPDWPDPEKPEAPPTEDPKLPNHCFPAGTKIATPDGDRPIEEIRPGDLVLTRAGWQPVLHAGPTGVRELVRFGSLVGTPDHPVWTENRGWVRLDELRGTDAVLYTCPRPETGTASRGTAIPKRLAALTALTFAATRQAARNTCTERSGSRTSVEFPKDTTFTTSTRTPETTGSRTSSAGRDASTSANTRESVLKRALKRFWRLWKKLELPHLRGTLRRRVSPGTANTAGEPWQPASQNNYASELFARSAVESLRHEQPESAEARATPAGSALVYDLSVAGLPEFVANGVLVHNCSDAALYAWRFAWHYLHEEKTEKPKRGTEAFWQREAEELEQRLMQKQLMIQQTQDEYYPTNVDWD